MSAKRKRRVKTAPAGRRRKARPPLRRAAPAPGENPRVQEDLGSVEDPLEDWPEDADEDRWLIERGRSDLQRPDDE